MKVNCLIQEQIANVRLHDDDEENVDEDEDNEEGDK